MKTNKGFTLIELLVVLAIVAILSVVVILTLNPAELLKQARDSNRISDLATMKSAISLYLADVTSPTLYWPADTTYTKCSMSITGTTASTSLCGGWFTNTTSFATTTTALYRKVDGTGWIPVNFTAISSGAPIGNLPIDPINNASYFYAYGATSTLTFELDTLLESTKYDDYMSSDGGTTNSAYEVGTAPGLSI